MRKALLFLVVGAALGIAPACNKDDGARRRTGARPRRPVAAHAAAPAAAAAYVRRCRWNSPWSSGPPVAEQILIVGNLIGAATVQVVPRVNGRLATVNVQLGDSVRRGQTVAKVEDLEIQEQVRQAEARLQGVAKPRSVSAKPT